MPEIIAALQFEAAIGEYFNITSNFHYSPGELTNRSGFRIFEVHMFWFRIISPWWESALNKSNPKFSSLYDYLNTNFTGEMKELKENQIEAGIAAGYNELMKMSKLLFTPPVIFLILVDPRKRCSFCRTLLSFIRWNTQELRSEAYNEFPFLLGPTFPKEEREWYDLLSSHTETLVCSHFITMGLHRQVVERDLFNIGVGVDEKPEVTLDTLDDDRHDGILTKFSNEFAVLFHALKGVFWRMPSSSLIAEQKAGTLRHIMYEGISQGMIDVASNFATNVNYPFRERRRQDERKRKAAEVSPEDSRNSQPTKRVRVGHDRTKSQQMQVARDVLEISTKYSPDRLKKLPKHVQKQAAIGTISERGFRYVEQDLTFGKMKEAIAREGNSKVKTSTYSEYKQIANNSVVNNDLTFSHMSPEEKERRGDIERFASFNFWKSLNLKDGFKQQLQVILPEFWSLISNMQDMSKKNILVELKKYLESLQKQITINASHHFTSAELESLDEIGRLSKFVHPSNYLLEKRQKNKRQINSITNVSRANGANIVYKK